MNYRFVTPPLLEFPLHKVQDSMQDKIIKLKTKLDSAQKLQEVFKSSNNQTIKLTLDRQKKDIENDLTTLIKQGIDPFELISKFGAELYKADVLKATNYNKEQENENGETELADVVDEDKLMERIRKRMADEEEEKRLDAVMSRIHKKKGIIRSKIFSEEDVKKKKKLLLSEEEEEEEEEEKKEEKKDLGLLIPEEEEEYKSESDIQSIQFQTEKGSEPKQLNNETIEAIIDMQFNSVSDRVQIDINKVKDDIMSKLVIDKKSAINDIRKEYQYINKMVVENSKFAKYKKGAIEHYNKKVAQYEESGNKRGLFFLKEFKKSADILIDHDQQAKQNAEEQIQIKAALAGEKKPKKKKKSK